MLSPIDQLCVTNDLNQIDGRVTCVRNAPSYLKYYRVTINSTKNEKAFCNKYLISSYMSYYRLSSNFKHVMLAIDTDHKPKNYRKPVSTLSLEEAYE